MKNYSIITLLLLVVSVINAQLVTSNLQLRYEPSGIVTTTVSGFDTVNQWTNSGLAGSDGNLLQATITNRPFEEANAVNGFNAVRFAADGNLNDTLVVTDNATLSTAFDNAPGLSFFAVVKIDAFTGTDALARFAYSGPGVTTPMDMLTLGDDLYAQSRNNANVATPSIISNFASAPTDWMLVAGVWDGAADSVQVWMSDASGTVAGTVNSTANGTPITFESLSLGLPTLAPDASFAEVLVYNRALSGAEVADNFAALSGTFAIPEPNSYAQIFGVIVLVVGLFARRGKRS